MSREYEKTHPWITYKLDTCRFSHHLWIALGEAKSKCEHISNVPLHPDMQDELHRVLLAKGAHATTSIEGNTLSEEEVLKHIKRGTPPPSEGDYETKEISNIVSAFNSICEHVFEDQSFKTTPEMIAEYNSMVLNGLVVEDGVVPGAIRSHSVGIPTARYRGAPPADCSYLLQRLCEWLNEDFPSPTGQYDLTWGLIKAIVAHVYIAWIHPFGDGNGRTARLLEFQLLLEAGVPTPTAHLLSNYYNKTRQEYYRQLDMASKSGGDLVPFIEYGVKGFVQGLRTELELIRQHQWDVAWRDYIYRRFENKKKTNERRQRDLLLDLSKSENPVSLSDIRSLSPKVAEMYANKTDKTIHLDVAKLVSEELLKRTNGAVRANRETILALLPRRRTAVGGDSTS